MPSTPHNTSSRYPPLDQSLQCPISRKVLPPTTTTSTTVLVLLGTRPRLEVKVNYGTHHMHTLSASLHESVIPVLCKSTSALYSLHTDASSTAASSLSPQPLSFCPYTTSAQGESQYLTSLLAWLSSPVDWFNCLPACGSFPEEMYSVLLVSIHVRALFTFFAFYSPCSPSIRIRAPLFPIVSPPFSLLSISLPLFVAISFLLFPALFILHDRMRGKCDHTSATWSSIKISEPLPGSPSFSKNYYPPIPFNYSPLFPFHLCSCRRTAYLLSSRY